jgi:ferredoxin
MKVTVDRELCQGHIRCVQIAPTIFHQDDQGLSYTSDDDVPMEEEARVRQAELNCPERAITITE